jgi:phosphinothricin acetyltransferase
MTTPIRAAQPADASALADIYNHYVVNDIATFEEEPVLIETMSARMADINGKSMPWLVAHESGKILGYAYASPWRPRSAYRFSVESTIYLAPEARHRGVGMELYGALVAELRQRNVHAAMGGVSLPNEASARLHEKLGFKKVAHFEQVGFKFGKWIDVGYWQLLF